jgi:C2H2-type zinc finger/Zinc finger, C2H2 type/Zinc-finger of C2H2 type
MLSLFQIDLENENLPKSICKDCWSRTESTYEFIELVQESEQKFLMKQEVTDGEEEEEQQESALEKLSKLKMLNVRSTRSMTRAESPNLLVVDRIVPACDDFFLSRKLETLSKNVTIQKVSAVESPQRKKVKISASQKTDIKQEPMTSGDEGDGGQENNFVDDNPATSSSEEEYSKPLRRSPTKSASTKSPNERNQPVRVITMASNAIFLCMTCKMKFSTFDGLKEHMQTCEACKMSTLTCETCGKISKHRKAFYQHRLSHRAKVEIVCELCGKVYTNKFNLENHKSLAHGEVIVEEGIIYKCQICNQQFSNRKTLFDHISSHSKDPVNLLCDECGKTFTSQDSLKAHVRSHLNIRNFRCEHCDKRFRSRTGLLQHTHIHTGEKAFKCSRCPREFAKRESLLIHERQHSGLLPYSCVHGDICSSSFASLNQLKIHLKRVHPNDRGPGPTAALTNALQKRREQEATTPPTATVTSETAMPMELPRHAMFGEESANLASFMNNRMSMLMTATGGMMPGYPEAYPGHLGRY